MITKYVYEVAVIEADCQIPHVDFNGQKLSFGGRLIAVKNGNN